MCGSVRDKRRPSAPQSPVLRGPERQPPLQTGTPRIPPRTHRHKDQDTESPCPREKPSRGQSRPHSQVQRYLREDTGPSTQLFNGWLLSKPHRCVRLRAKEQNVKFMQEREGEGRDQVKAAIQGPLHIQHCVYGSYGPSSSRLGQPVLGDALRHGLGVRQAGLIPWPGTPLVT